MYFDFSSEERRDDVIRRISEALEARRVAGTAVISPLLPTHQAAFLRSSSRDRIASPSGGAFTDSPESIVTPTRTNSPLGTAGPSTDPELSNGITPAPLATVSHVLSPLARTIDRATSRRLPAGALPLLPKVINLPQGMLPRTGPMHFVCLTIGSRGDVQPYIALGQTLLREGHGVTIVTHEEYKEWVEGWGIKHRTAGGDPGALMKLSVEHKVGLSEVACLQRKLLM